MTTITLDSPISTGRLEELVDRLLAALFRVDAEQPASNLARNIHEARRLRQSGDLDGALATLADVDTRQADDAQLRWLYAEWLDVTRRRFAGSKALLYSPVTGKAALVLAGDGDGNTLEVAAVLGVRWQVGKLVSRRSLRGLKTLHNKNNRNNNKGGATWQ